MIKETAILIIISLATIGCMYLFIPYTVIYFQDNFFHPAGAFAFLAFIGLMCFGGFYIYRLNIRSHKSAIVFLAVLLVVILFSAAYIYWLVSSIEPPLQ